MSSRTRPIAGAAAPLSADAGTRFDWLVVAATWWFGIGLFSDGWAHIERLPDSFWTLWHAILYSGYAATAAVIVGAVALRRPVAPTWRAAIPRGYEASVVGAAVFAVGGLLDMAWHVAFGVEVGSDALLSPSHLLLALGGALLATGPLRADLYRGSRFTNLGEDAVFRGLLGMFVFSAFQSGVLLVMLRRTVLPVGTLPLLLGLNAIAMNLMHSHGPLPVILTFVAVAFGTGVIGEILLAALRPSAERPVALRTVAALVPMVFWSLYFAAVFLLRGLGWSFTFVSGAIVLCGVVGLLLSYVAIPPARQAS